MPLIENPPWTNRALKQNWETILSTAHEHSLPMPVKPPTGWKFEELGCGHYGCVLATERKGTVFKLTSDPTEARFVQRAAQFGWPEGIVEYFAIIELDFTFRRRPVFAIWREEAWDVGELSPGWDAERNYENNARNMFSHRLEQFRDHAARARDQLKKSKDREALWVESKSFENWAWQNIGLEDAEGKHRPSSPNLRSYFSIDGLRGPRRLAASWRACEIIAEMMEHEYLSDLVGRTLSFYLEKQFLLADVHLGNVGKADRDGYLAWVITDPGHVVIVED